MAVVTAADWMKGIGLSVTASIIGGASKLAIRKSWVMLDQSNNSSTTNHGDGTSYRQLRSPKANKTFDTQGFKRSSSSSSSSAARRRTSPSVVRQEQQQQQNQQQSSTSYHDAEACTSVTATTATSKNTSAVDLNLNEYHHGNGVTSANSSSSFTSSKQTPLLQLNISTNGSEDERQNQSIQWHSRVLRYSGMCGMTILNPICCVWAMEFASPSILAPFSGLTLVWIILFSDCVIQERPTTMQIRAAGWIVFGEVIVACFGDHTNETRQIDHTIRHVTMAYHSFGVIVFCVCFVAWMTWITCVLLSSYNNNNNNTSHTDSKVQRFAWGVAGGSITGLQNFLKDALTISKLTETQLMNSNPDMTARELVTALPPLFWIFGLCAAASSFTGLLLLTACMKRYDATYSSSMFVGSFVLTASAMAAVRYETFSHLESMWNYILYPTGLLVLLRDRKSVV